MSVVLFVSAVIFGLMLAETRVSSRHEQLLRAQGAHVPAGDVYRALAVLYPAAFLVMSAEGWWRASEAGRIVTGSGSAGLVWLPSGVLLFAASKALKYWAIGSLGTRWTFRVVVLPGAPLVTRGPYRYVTHPNYIAVVGELVGAAMMVGAPVTGPIAIAVFGLVLWSRVRFENRVLDAIQRQTP